MWIGIKEVSVRIVDVVTSRIGSDVIVDGLESSQVEIEEVTH